MNQPTLQMLPVYTSLFKLKKTNKALTMNVIMLYCRIAHTIMTTGNRAPVSVNYEWLAATTGTFKRTAQDGIHALVKANLIEATKGQHSRMTYSLKVLPYEMEGLSDEEREEIKEVWNDLYNND